MNVQECVKYLERQAEESQSVILRRELSILYAPLLLRVIFLFSSDSPLSAAHASALSACLHLNTTVKELDLSRKALPPCRIFPLERPDI